MIPLAIDEDVAFFREHPKRQIRLRKARSGEKAEDFAKLGWHLPDRRRILSWKVPVGSRIGAGEILRIPFLQFADETIEDTDAVLLPILNDMMMGAAKEYGMKPPKQKRE